MRPNSLIRGGLALGLSLGLAAGCSGGESITKSPDSPSVETPRLNEDENFLLDGLEGSKQDFEKSILEGGLQANVMLGVCAIIGVKAHGEYLAYTIPNPLNISYRRDEETEISVFAGYDPTEGRFIYGVPAIVTRHGGSIKARALGPTSDEAYLVVDEAVQARNSEIVFDEERKQLLDIISGHAVGTVVSVGSPRGKDGISKYADSPLTGAICSAGMDDKVHPSQLD